MNYLLFGSFINYVAVPQHGSLSLYTKLKGPSPTKLAFCFPRYRLPMNFKGPCISMVTASHTYPCAFLLMRVVSLPLSGKSLAPMKSFCNHTLALSSQIQQLSGTWPVVHFLESMTEVEWRFISWLSVHFLDSPLRFDIKSRLQINMGVAVMSRLRSWAYLEDFTWVERKVKWDLWAEVPKYPRWALHLSGSETRFGGDG